MTFALGNHICSWVQSNLGFVGSPLGFFWVCRLSSWVLLLGFAAGFIAGIHWFVGSPIRFAAGFVWFLLGFVFVFVFVWVRHCFYFVPCLWTFFRGEQRKKKKRD